MSAFQAIVRVVRVAWSGWVRVLVRGRVTDQSASDLRRVRVVRVVRGLLNLHMYVWVYAQRARWRGLQCWSGWTTRTPDHRSVAASGRITPLAAVHKDSGGATHVTGSARPSTGSAAEGALTDRFVRAALSHEMPVPETADPLGIVRFRNGVGNRIDPILLLPCSGRYMDAPIDRSARP